MVKTQNVTDNQTEPKINKELLGKVRRMALGVYIERANHDGTHYLTPEEMIARAYVEGFKSVIESMGYEIRPVSKK